MKTRSLPNSGVSFAPKNEEQQCFLQSMQRNYLTVCKSRQFGNGKTYCAIGHASKLLEDHAINRVVFCRDTSQVSDRLGYSPGSRKEKLFESVKFALSYFRFFLGDSFQKYSPSIEYRDVADIAGETFEDAFMILDEAADCSLDDITMFISRAGRGTRCAILGTDRQVTRNASCFRSLFHTLQGVPNVGLIELTQILRTDWLRAVLDAIDGQSSDYRMHA